MKKNLYDTDFGDYDFQAELNKNPELSEVKPVDRKKTTKPSETIDYMLNEQGSYLRQLNDSIHSGLSATETVMYKEISMNFYIVEITSIISKVCDIIKNILWLNKIAFTKSSYAGVPEDSLFTGQYDKNTIFITEINSMIDYHSWFIETIKAISTKAELDNNSLATHIDGFVYLVNGLLEWEEAVLANMIYSNATTKYMCKYYKINATLVLDKLKEYKNLLEDNLS